MAIFVEKSKEPKLSQEMQDLLSRSQGSGSTDKYDDIERYKYKIWDLLVNNKDLLRTLHTETLQYKTNSSGEFVLDDKGNKIEKSDEELNGDAYKFVSIFDFLKIPDIQSTVKNYVCFEVHNIELPRYSKDILITKNILFRTISHDHDYHTDWGINRQDLLAAIIKTEFDWNNFFGMHWTLVSDKGRTAEDGYYYREFVYEVTDVNNMVNKFQNGNRTR